jgi:16S rRNA (guanine1516-N2)-methyltransferase
VVVNADARELLARPGREAPDAVLLDPMFPRDDRTALGRGELQILRQLVGADEDAAELLEHALACARRRVVVKRPAHAALLGGRAPQLRLTGTSTRFDVYLVAPAR